jgi:lipoyl(octanoyl) transferase
MSERQFTIENSQLSIVNSEPPPRPPLHVIQPGVVPYAEAVALQERLHQDRLEGRIPDTLLLLEHPPVITLGRRAHEEHLLLDREALARRGVEVHEAARGGDVTYHGPGQLVGYPIIDLMRRGKDVHRYLRDVEEALIRALAHWGLNGERVPELTGVWVGNDKVAAIGIGVRRWVTWHGFALNVTTELDAFRMIVPCGIRDRGVTSLARLLGREVPEREVVQTVVRAFCEVFGIGSLDLAQA